ncbi:polynucleotide kinase-phosphatase [bacterium]|nr:polynucleotide kinase-phosphatase [bacterium]
MNIEVPQFSLVLLLGASGSGKSSFASKHFLPTETISSDFCRGLVSDDENDQACSQHAFEILHTIVAKRLELGRLTVVDATHVQPESRRPLLALARKYHVLPCAVVFDLPEEVCQARNQSRPDRQFGHHVVRNHTRALRRSLRNLKLEGFRYIYKLHSPTEVDDAMVSRVKVWNDKRDDMGPFDIIGDVHGCLAELELLLEKLQPRRKLVFLGDLVDRGPDTPGVLRKVMQLVANGQALCVPGNHDTKLLKYLNGKKVQLTHGLAETVEQLHSEPPEFIEQLKKFLDGLISHYQLDGGRLIVAHAGLKAEMQGRTSGAVREFCLYGETTGETDEFGLPVRYNWAAEYRGQATVVYGHTPVLEPEWLNKTINIDTGCAFGGKLTALRYPEMELVQVPAARVYAQPIRPLQSSAPSLESDALDLAHFLGRRTLKTRYLRPLTIQEEFSIAALESLSRFAVDPRWLIYLPPTMSPAETSEQPGYLEHPLEALAGYQSMGVERVICQEKHMGSRAVVVVCRHPEAARRFFWDAPGIGSIYTRTGRSFFDDLATETALLGRLQSALELSGLWDQLQTSWMCLDCELMPWSLKAQSLLKDQYAAVGSAALAHLRAVLEVIPESLRSGYQQRLDDAYRYRQAYQRYCWDTPTLEQIRLAPFHLLASEGQVHSPQTHLWHMQMFEKVGRQDAIFQPTRWLQFDLSHDPQPVIQWWMDLTAAGGEGMVIKPETFLTTNDKGMLIQPAIKCRGKEYLRIIYGPDYDREDQLVRLRKRSLGRKRSLALRQLALGLEGLERFVAHESLTRVHECAFGVMALESEPVDPRL